MADHEGFKHEARRTAIISVALVACVIFGIIVLASGDWLPGGIIVAASTVGLVRLVPVIRRLWTNGYSGSPSHKTVK